MWCVLWWGEVICGVCGGAICGVRWGCTVEGNVDSRLNIVLGDRSVLAVPD